MYPPQLMYPVSSGTGPLYPVSSGNGPLYPVSSGTGPLYHMPMSMSPAGTVYTTGPGQSPVQYTPGQTHVQYTTGPACQPPLQYMYHHGNQNTQYESNAAHRNAMVKTFLNT